MFLELKQELRESVSKGAPEQLFWGTFLWVCLSQALKL